VNLLEEEIEVLTTNKNSFVYDISPYQVLSFRVIPD